MLDEFPAIQVCVAYEIDGKQVDTPPASINAFNRAKPILEELPGWHASSTEARRFEDLPKNAQTLCASHAGAHRQAD